MDKTQFTSLLNSQISFMWSLVSRTGTSHPRPRSLQFPRGFGQKEEGEGGEDEEDGEEELEPIRRQVRPTELLSMTCLSQSLVHCYSDGSGHGRRLPFKANVPISRHPLVCVQRLQLLFFLSFSKHCSASCIMYKDFADSVSCRPTDFGRNLEPCVVLKTVASPALVHLLHPSSSPLLRPSPS